METTESKWVPWLDGIQVTGCYVVQDLQIEIARAGQQVDRPRHLILTGRNGSGKSSILRALNTQISDLRMRGGVVNPKCHTKPHQHILQKNGDYRYINWAPGWGMRNGYSYASFATDRISVKAITVDQVENELKGNPIYNLPVVGMEFERFMLSLKFSSLFSKEEQNVDMIAYYDHFFETVLNLFRKIFEDGTLKLTYDMQRLTFSFVFEDGRNVNVRDLADGYFSFVMIVLNLFARQEEIRKENKYIEADIPGLVLIDEPELHLHLDLQYEIMPLLTELFPKIQFIVATHSPAVISSIRNATVYDLSKREYAPSYIAGESFSSLMESHFGLENEFGPVADELLGKVKHIYLNGGTKLEKSAAIRSVMEKYQDIITPTLRVELESTIIHLEVEAAR